MTVFINYLKNKAIVFKKLITIAGLSLFLFAGVAIAHEGYHYAGVTNTTGTASTTQATITHRENPDCSWCHTLEWTVLWDSNASGQYAEAGVGYSSWWSTPRRFAHLWYATPNGSEVTGVTVGKVALGTPVTITIVKNTDQSATILWSWQECKRVCSQKQIVKTVAMPGWIDQDGIHPTKMEVYSSDGSHPSSCADFTNVAIYPDDINASLQETDPYYVTSGSTLENFSVRYNCSS